MNAAGLFHTGLVVDDIEAAKVLLAEASGYHWGPSVGGDVPIQTPDGEQFVPMLVAFSVDEPRIELVQAIPGTIWQPSDSGLHHLGYWSEDVAADVDGLLARGYAVEASAPNPDGSSMWAYCKSSVGPRIELVDRGMEPVLSGLFLPEA